MTLKIFNDNGMDQNVYLYYDEMTGKAFLIDAGCGESDVKELAAFLNGNGLAVEAILLTHGHYDHLMGARRVKEITSAAVYCHESEQDALEHAEVNLSARCGMNITIQPDFTLKEGDALYLSGEKAVFKVLHTPGHTPGCVCYYDEENGVLFSGDTLFRESIGRTDLPGGSHGGLIRSLKEKLLTLPDDTKVYPGHGESTTIGHERKRNPFLRP